METVASRASFAVFTDAALLELLRTEEDRLPRAAAEEILRRGAALREALADLCREERAWRRTDAASWAPVHATFLLGALGGAVEPLLASLRWAVEYDVDVVTEVIHLILGAQGPAAATPLRGRIADRERGDFERALAVDALGTLASRFAAEQGEALEFLRGVVADERDEDEVRDAAAAALLRFARPADREVVAAWVDGAARSWSRIDARDVEEAYLRRGAQPGPVVRDWMGFYDADEIVARRRRVEERAEDERWALGARWSEPWVESELEGLLAEFGGALGDLAPETRRDALWTARAMMRYLVGRVRVAPWRWDADRATSFLFDYVVRCLPVEREGLLGAAPIAAARFARFWEEKGRVTGEARQAIEDRVAAQGEEFVRAALDSRNWTREKLLAVRMAADGLDATDDRNASEWRSRYATRFPRVAGLPVPAAQRGAECACGSARAYRRCCGR
jgi:hypothetical protein